MVELKSNLNREMITLIFIFNIFNAIFGLTIKHDIYFFLKTSLLFTLTMGFFSMLFQARIIHHIFDKFFFIFQSKYFISDNGLHFINPTNPFQSYLWEDLTIDTNASKSRKYLNVFNRVCITSKKSSISFEYFINWQNQNETLELFLKHTPKNHEIFYYLKNYKDMQKKL